MKRLVIVFALVVSVGLNAKNLSDEEFFMSLLMIV